MNDLMVVTELKCKGCDKPLYGGLDTYGPSGQEICKDCFFTGVIIFDGTPSEVYDEIIDEIEDAEGTVEGLESDLDDAENELSDCIKKLKDFCEQHPEFKKNKKVKKYL